ncbi:hypothetical protein ACN27G_29315 [Plantactinospora sp. WMMB334]|uniref:hypothetical protein n=1 Tax=Plantactinospora sp. WMMB334 TaxID=3404119 RepID=UPI003B9511DF
MAHLAMTCVADRHGEAKLFGWWYAMVEGGSHEYEQATRTHLGEGITTLERACVSYIHRAVGS